MPSAKEKTLGAFSLNFTNFKFYVKLTLALTIFLKGGDGPKGDKEMVKYAKPKRTMRKGLRPLPFQQLTPPPNLSRKAIEKMKKILFDEALANGKPREELSERELFAIDHAYLVVLFHRGEKAVQEIWRDENKGHQAGFSQEEISSLNFVILEEKQKGQLEPLFQRLEAVGAK